MSSSDAFAFKNSGLSTFLLAEVGTELNGSPLTILSVLARLGLDPWAEAAKWTKLPRATTIDRLTQSIAQMPLQPQALLNARDTASRLIQLLPAPVARSVDVPARGKRVVPKWALVVICLVAVALGFAFTIFPISKQTTTVTPVNELSVPPSRPPPIGR